MPIYNHDEYDPTCGGKYGAYLKMVLLNHRPELPEPLVFSSPLFHEDHAPSPIVAFDLDLLFLRSHAIVEFPLFLAPASSS